MLKMKRTERSSHCSWIKTIMHYMWRSPAALSASPSVAVSVMDHVKSKLMFLSLPWVFQEKIQVTSVWLHTGLVLHLETHTVAG